MLTSEQSQRSREGTGLLRLARFRSVVVVRLTSVAPSVGPTLGAWPTSAPNRVCPSTRSTVLRHSTDGMPRNNFRSRGSIPSPAASTRRCTPVGPGRCANTRVLVPRRNPMPGTANSSRRAPPVCPLRSICLPRWATTQTIRSLMVKWARWVWRLIRSTTCGCSSPTSPLIRSQPR